MEINGVNVHNSNQKDVAEMIRVSFLLLSGIYDLLP